MQINLKDIKLSKSTLHEFALAMLSAESDSLKEVSLNEFFGNKKRHTSESSFINAYEHKKLQYVWIEFFKDKGWTEDKAVSFGYLSELPPTTFEIEVSPDKFIKGYKDAVLFYSKKDGSKLCIEISPTPRGGFYYTFYATLENDPIFQDLTKLADEKNLYKGKKIDCDCRFLKLDDISWEDVILDDGIEEVIKSNIVDSFKMRDTLKKFSLPVKRGIILHGPPGTGKTKICKCLAKDAEYSVLYALPADFSQNNGGIRRVTDMAKDLAPCLLIIEDLDWIAQHRGSGNAPFVMELMNQIDGIESFGDIITLGTTNCLSELENAIKNRPGRFDRIIKIDVPTEKSRKKMIEKFTNNFILDKDVDTNKLSSVLDKLTGAHVFDLCTTAALFAVKDDSIINEKLVIKKKHFDEAIKEVKDKDYSSYAELQGKQKGFGFSQASNLLMDDYLEL